MPLLENGRLVPDIWTILDEEAPFPATGPVIVPLSRLEEGLARAPGEKLGVAIPQDAEIDTLRTVLPRLSLVAVTFPIFRDGRAFSQARALREHLHFTGEIRATGKPLPDQYEFLLRCGVSTVDLPPGSDPEVWARAHTRFRTAYQPSVLGERAEGVTLRRVL
ncbi:DUF934 domain-containing protein [Gluconacetobacter asukensis]|uniref:DUF934 domain-containing protein n=1 Tax=Gluconacetobacter asukensis TaxID=1017181 RepID=A0A7W4NYJ2_9PROT|nr:DUF934 domain-containing protein [Gluconacetobacter asukensis]MBB2170907.1 DUF934 domain-containing protein [Gluconacetobacter asukensis]